MNRETETGRKREREKARCTDKQENRHTKTASGLRYQLRKRDTDGQRKIKRQKRDTERQTERMCMHVP